MGSSPKVVPKKFVVDSVHGDIHLTAREWRILDTMPFQRLRNLKQLGMGQVTYPNATHTRFAHSLGTLGIMAKILEVAKDTLSTRNQENLRLAALLHDIGQYPYSHLMERIDEVALTEEEIRGGTRRTARKKSFDASGTRYPSHEELGVEIVTHQRELVDGIGGPERAKEVADLFARTKAANPQLSKLLHSSFDMDRVDYLQRDSRAAGVPYGNIDVNYLLNSLRISRTGMVGVAEKALPAADQFLLARFFMHRTVYYHKTTYGLEEACRQLLRRIRDAQLFDIPVNGRKVFELVRSPSLGIFTDSYVDRLISQASQEGKGVVRALAQCIATREPPKLLKEVLVLEPTESSHHAGSMFWVQARSSLASLSKKHHIRLGQFLLCKTNPVGFEKLSAHLSRKQARGLPPEEEDEEIKVFVGNDSEPKSLVEIKHSLIHVCSTCFWQAFRLYVVYEGEDQDRVVRKLRKEVRDWGSA